MNTQAISNLSDEQLVSLIKKDIPYAMDILYRRYFSRVNHKCYSFVRNYEDSFDLAQDILLKAFERIHSYRERSSFSTWLYAIAHNHCISYTHKSARMMTEDIRAAGHLAEDSMNTEELEFMAEHEQKISDTVKILSELTINEREMLEKKYHHNYSVLDLQREFNLSASAVKMRLMRARQKVEKRLRNAAA